MYLPPVPPAPSAASDPLQFSPCQAKTPAPVAGESDTPAPLSSVSTDSEGSSAPDSLGSDPAEPRQTETAGDQAAVSSSAARILLVDDDPEIIESVRYTLEANDYEVVVARDGNQAVALAERERPDLMILDMMMPKRSGFLVLEHLRRQLELPLPVIMITGNEGSRHQAYAELLGVSEYLHKPFSMDKLLAAVARLLSNA